MRSEFRAILASLLLVGIGAARCEAEPSSGYEGMMITVAKVDRKCSENLIDVSGTLVPKAEVDVRADSDGMQISEILVEPGDTVASGQVLARLIQAIGTPPRTAAIKSPVSGVAISISANLGSLVSPKADKPLFRIVTDGELELKGQVSASLLPRLKPGQSVTIKIIGIGQLEGRLEGIESAIDPMTQLGSVDISVPADTRLRSGAFARAEVHSGETCAMVVPLSALLYGPEGAVVQVVRAGRIETHRVTVGPFEKGLVQIADGVDVGDLVVERAGTFFREGDKVRIAGPQSDSKP